MKVPDFIIALLNSRKFWLAVFAIAAKVFEVLPDGITVAERGDLFEVIAAACVVLASLIALEDAAEKSGATLVVDEEE